MLVGRLGLETARLPHADRHGLVFLDRGRLTVEDGCLTFDCAGGGMVPAGRYGLPHQSVSLMLLGPGSSVSHDALRLLARHGVGLAAIGADGVRFYTAQPLLPDFSHLARAQARLWADERRGRPLVARRMYALRLGEVLPHRDIAVLRGIEGARMKETYRIEAERAGIAWHGRRYDRQNPNAADLPNQALNHAASAVEAAAAIAVASTATIPQLGFIHEDSGQSFVLDVADLVRDTVTIPVAFKAAALARKRPADGVERIARRMAGERLKRDGVVSALIDRIKTVLAPTAEDEDDRPLHKSMPAAGRLREDGDGHDGDRDA
ncbi:type I-E CRISPR-associated endonuclease Cas1e [Aurantimonas sp. Leaf443]|uniref:type I-E CRISPR-associated endonuclease Cas1e n=1 Tax=Aurantimonas sp. Leaf443 TaxID=1736378 RepID=UPI0007000D43|nr:type I-E CRISPR-associated endonuclease Cas1e [Aurantimonas sp. Leaf443]KQT88476.1 type I-E CRISPR-associated endonuclease Cas1 [Aurantimonas sp. Leaf443]